MQSDCHGNRSLNNIFWHKHFVEPLPLRSCRFWPFPFPPFFSPIKNLKPGSGSLVRKRETAVAETTASVDS